MLDRADRITATERWARTMHRLRGRTLCLLGVHWWAHRTNPGVGGARARYQECHRCRRERTQYALRWDVFER